MRCWSLILVNLDTSSILFWTLTFLRHLPNMVCPRSAKLLYRCFKPTFSHCLTRAPPQHSSQCLLHWPGIPDWQHKRISWEWRGLESNSSCTTFPEYFLESHEEREGIKSTTPLCKTRYAVESILKILSFVEPISERWVNSSNLKRI